MLPWRLGLVASCGATGLAYLYLLASLCCCFLQFFNAGLLLYRVQNHLSTRGLQKQVLKLLLNRSSVSLPLWCCTFVLAQMWIFFSQRFHDVPLARTCSVSRLCSVPVAQLSTSDTDQTVEASSKLQSMHIGAEKQCQEYPQLHQDYIFSSSTTCSLLYNSICTISAIKFSSGC